MFSRIVKNKRYGTFFAGFFIFATSIVFGSFVYENMSDLIPAQGFWRALLSTFLSSWYIFGSYFILLMAVCRFLIKNAAILPFNKLIIWFFVAPALIVAVPLSLEIFFNPYDKPSITTYSWAFLVVSGAMGSIAYVYGQFDTDGIIAQSETKAFDWLTNTKRPMPVWAIVAVISLTFALTFYLIAFLVRLGFLDALFGATK